MSTQALEECLCHAHFEKPIPESPVVVSPASTSPTSSLPTSQNSSFLTTSSVGESLPLSKYASITSTPCYVHTRFEDIVDVGSVLQALSSTDNMSNLSHSRLVETATGVRQLAKRLGEANISINARSIMIVTKARDNSLIYLTRDLAYWLMATPRNGLPHGPTVYVDSKLEGSKRFNAASLLQVSPVFSGLLKFWTPEMTSETPEKFDLVITLGGDGTVLYVGGLFQHVVPPIISFSLGSLGFLTNFGFEDYKSELSRVFESGINVNLRMRFSCTIFDDSGKRLATHQVLNEIVIDRGPSPWVSMLELYGNDALLTVVQADGLILSTPTGSTAYSLSAGGSLVHPEIPAISVTPICPHTLSFRPMLLPDSMVLRVTLPARSRATAWASFDGRNRFQLQPGYCVTVRASQYPFPTIVSSPTEYIDSVSRTLKWNVREQQKPFEHLLSTPTLRQYNDDNHDLLSSKLDAENAKFLPLPADNQALHLFPDKEYDIDYDDELC